LSVLETLNQAPPAEAAALLKACCGSSQWAREMVMLRPFADPAALYRAADAVWSTLDADDWHEAFLAHPRIGERKAAPTQDARAAAWSSQEQSAATADGEAAALAAANQAYEARFGHIFIVCATGLSAGEMLARLQARMENDAETELKVAAAEQAKITRLRLEKLLAE
jgi:OHCU decarboxylase